MKLLTKLKTLFTRDEVKQENLNIKLGLDVIPLFCNEIEDDSHYNLINVLFYLDFDETKVSILDLLAYGSYDHRVHLFKITLENLIKMRLEQENSYIVKEFFLRIAVGSDSFNIVDNELDEESIKLCVVDIISKYSSYNSLRAYNNNENSEIDIPCVDRFIYELRQTCKSYTYDYTKYVLAKIRMVRVPLFYLIDLFKLAEDIWFEVNYDKPHNCRGYRSKMTYFFEGKQFGLNEEEVIYSIINMSKGNILTYMSTLPLGVSVNVELSTSLDRIITFLATSGNDDLKTIIKDELLENVFDEKDLESLRYHAKATDEEIKYDIDEEIDEVVSYTVLEDDENA